MATNMIKNFADVLSVACTAPTSPVKGDPVRFNTRTGVALTSKGAGGNSTNNTTVDFGNHVWDLSVKAINDDGNSAVAVGDPIFYVDGDTPPLSKKTSQGFFFGYAQETITSGSTDTINVLHIAAPGAGGRPGFIPLDITLLRIIATNAIGNLSEGMLLDGNTAPSLARVNAATDKALRVIWASASSVECRFPAIPKPPDIDEALPLTVHLMCAKDTNTDNTVTIAVSIWDGVGDTNAGGNTAALSTATLTEYSVTMAGSDLAAAPGFLNVGLTPGTHTTDAIYLYAAWIEYTKVS